MIIVGIDPGMSGGLCYLVRNHGVFFPIIEKMPEDDVAIMSLLETFMSAKAPFFIEKIPHFIPGKNIMGSQMSKLTGNQRFIYGFLRGRMQCDVVQVTPQEWQKAIKTKWDLPKRASLTTSQWKNALRDVACNELSLSQKQLPLWAADAALIALHGMRSHFGSGV
tara:strand:+ start:4105 stop:4599 length:495 start_codon:yes stop_codon:yes gene_type:complete